ncbi:MAG TPA: 3,4-dihydroxy-2-butanone-4-phosphate synthase [Hyphomonas atlantica]|uniref:3,4-dihydroxy-2-butanone 4-phosphate synthase n=1 Tax=Hyphomonas atlantica TaxID=1280948 RepID=A0A356W3L5_9PROT|nr:MULTISPECIES: 3,4-dihydroxy-2-butanone-4-phosphate synthase [Hyphomonas]MAM07775.1 3,4-dihydroxy-2-butanone-4-phosphate synthase [Hyphomonas sp.]HAE95063.1 3,4-dihydroxy-2-butanone-4-phosphate synthase [Hyphomonas atlantica]HBF91987.1 3,4-dihydroxy-2-butanone-4-phosphate synthase [Hyphomonas atlantica]HBH44761.1 3,4-dihydroxy-2-butanone-4-phosphate synthase [Hyphomonas atlantica]HBQ48219.1 3,4-dihydroxy-2-butanone-4-phosphate synthase [Hyphomonas atlantica]|tara:strand:- start:387 stop:1514 length:1128 start_codon:yes stop_codon:yes gene_type:complete
MSSEFHEAISSIDEIIEDARNGRMYILVDAEDRENEGDLIIPANFATPEHVNFMARHGRGLICLAMTQERAHTLNLDMMTRNNRESMGTAFTVSIEAKEGVTTGISAHDRSRTIAVAIDPTKDHEDIVSPGHVFPLIAREGGTLVRAGHTEAAVDISRMAGLYPAGVICEIMNEDGSMSRLPELVAFAQLHNLKIGTIADLIAWRRKNDRFMERRVEAPLNSGFGEGFKTVCFRNALDNSEHIAIVHGDITPDSTTLVRVHRMDVLSDVLGENGPRQGLVGRAMRMIADADEPGVIVFVNTIRPNVIAERLGLKPSAPADPTAPIREYGVGAQILRDLGVRKMIYLSGTQPTRLAGLDGYGLSIEGWRKLDEESN